MTAPAHQIYIVEDDASVAAAYTRLFRSAHIDAQTFSSVEDFLRSGYWEKNACIVASMDLFGTNGLELRSLLARARHEIPIIFLTADVIPEAWERALEAGGAAFFEKPVDGDVLLDAVAKALTGGAL